MAIDAIQEQKKFAIAQSKARSAKAALERNKSRSDSQIYEDRLRLRPDGIKKCSGSCKRRKALDQFPNSRGKSDGLGVECKKCLARRTNRLAKRRSLRNANQIRKDAKRMRPSDDKICGGCQARKPLGEFWINSRTADGHAAKCKMCQSADVSLHKARLAEMRDELRKKGCVDCGLKDIRCIDLAHRKREDKLRNEQGFAVNPAHITSVIKLQEELKLVDPKCANCHAKQTQDERQELKISTRPRDDVEREQRSRALVNMEKTKRGVCIDCKLPVQDRFWLFDFDHVRGEKIEGVAKMVGRLPNEAILLEMTKCDLRCKNCHRIATHERRQKIK